MSNNIISLDAYRNKSKFDGNECLDESCVHVRECANHCTAGDYRSEDGDSPNISIVDGKLSCDGTLTEEQGMVYLKDGKLARYTGPNYFPAA